MTSFEKFVAGYLQAAAWSSDDGDHEGLEGFEFAPCAVLQAQAECRAFIDACGPLIEQAAELREWDCLGHDFWLTRAGHGTGFWDRDELDVGPCATVYGRYRWDGPCYSSDQCGGDASLGDVLSYISYGTDCAISEFAHASCGLGDDGLIYFD